MAKVIFDNLIDTILCSTAKSSKEKKLKELGKRDRTENVRKERGKSNETTCGQHETTFCQLVEN